MGREGVVCVAVVAFFIGCIIGCVNREEPQVVYRYRTRTVTEYRDRPNSVPRATLESEVARARDVGFTEGRRIGTDEGFRNGFAQGTEHGQNNILRQIDLRVQEAERTDRNVPLFRVIRD